MNSSFSYNIACLISGRNLGDAVIQSTYVHQLMNRGFAERLIVWTRPESEQFFVGIRNCEIVKSFFPVGTNKTFNKQGILSFASAVKYIRSKKINVSLDMFGDFRERLFAYLIGSRNHKFIGWEDGHYFNKNIRNPFRIINPACIIDQQTINIYNSYQKYIDVLSPHGITKPPKIKKNIEDPNSLKIGLHPFASQKCRLWPNEKWLQLAQSLYQTGHRITVYSAPSEANKLNKIFKNLSSNIRFSASSINGFVNDLSSMDLLIGLDSFSVHIASKLGLRVIVISGASHPEMWAPPEANVVYSTGGCINFPCMNKPSCIGGDMEYACIRSVEIADILEHIKKIR